LFGSRPASGEEQAVKTTPKAMRICFLGDSFVSGAFDSQCLGWVGRISTAARARGHDVSPYNLGIRGENSVQLAERWRHEVMLRHTPLQEVRLVFEFGMNDVRDVNGKPQLEETQSLAAARCILSTASQSKPTLMVGPPPVNDEPRNSRVRSISGQFAALCSELGIAYFDSHSALRETEIWLRDIGKIDGTHPSAAGYAEWARLLGDWPAWREWLP
jgi:lysophospholipase L1-like esterase